MNNYILTKIRLAMIILFIFSPIYVGMSSEDISKHIKFVVGTNILHKKIISDDRQIISYVASVIKKPVELDYKSDVADPAVYYIKLQSDFIISNSVTNVLWQNDTMLINYIKSGNTNKPDLFVYDTYYSEKSSNFVILWERANNVYADVAKAPPYPGEKIVTDKGSYIDRADWKIYKPQIEVENGEVYIKVDIDHSFKSGDTMGEFAAIRKYKVRDNKWFLVSENITKLK